MCIYDKTDIYSPNNSKLVVHESSLYIYWTSDYIPYCLMSQSSGSVEDFEVFLYSFKIERLDANTYLSNCTTPVVTFPDWLIKPVISLLWLTIFVI